MSNQFVSIYHNDSSCTLTDIYEISLIPHVQIMHNRCLVEMGQFSHVVGLIEFCGVHFICIFRTDFSLLDKMKKLC